MNLGQTMLTAGMLILLIMCVVSANRMISENTQAQFQSQALVASASLANDLLLEILSKKFDFNSDSLGGQGTGAFSPYQQLGGWGPGPAEQAACPLPDSSDTGAFKSKTVYGDVDDYDGYLRTAVAGEISGFHLSVVVYYVSAGSPDTKQTSRSFFKKIEVTVSHPLYMKDEVVDGIVKVRNAAVYSAVASY